MPSNDGTASLPVELVAPERIQVDPKRFQFRHSASSGPSGIRNNERISGSWDEERHGEPLLLFEDRHKNLFVVDGHHRLEFAKRLNQRFFSNAPKLLKAQILHESEGISAEQAKIFGAYRNIRNLGITEPIIGERLVEAAEVIHEVLKQRPFAQNLPTLPDTPAMMQATLAASLDDVSFGIATKHLPEEMAIPIAAYTATQPMPNATRVKVLSVIANTLAPIKEHDS